MGRSRKSQIASSEVARARGRRRRTAWQAGKSFKEGGWVVRMRTAMSPWCGSEEWKEWGRGCGGCNPLASLEQPGPDEPLETCFTHVCGHIMAFHDLYDCIPITFAPHWCFLEEWSWVFPFFFLLQLWVWRRSSSKAPSNSPKVSSSVSKEQHNAHRVGAATFTEHVKARMYKGKPIPRLLQRFLFTPAPQMWTIMYGLRAHLLYIEHIQKIWFTLQDADNFTNTIIEFSK